jgi:hypothetical protein
MIFEYYTEWRVLGSSSSSNSTCCSAMLWCPCTVAARLDEARRFGTSTYHSSLLAFAPKLTALASLSREFELECSSACASDLILRGTRVLLPGLIPDFWPKCLCLVQLPRGSLHCSIGTRDPRGCWLLRRIFVCRILEFLADELRQKRLGNRSNSLLLFQASIIRRSNTICAQPNRHFANQ